MSVNETGVEFGIADDFELSNELDKKAELFFRENLNLFRAIEKDDELKRWFKDYSFYSHSEGHEGLEAFLMDEVIKRAYNDGIVIHNYGEIIEKSGIDNRMICKPTKEWASSLSKIQIIACVAFHYRADHFDEGSLFNNSIGEGLFIPLFEAYIEKCSSKLGALRMK